MEETTTGHAARTRGVLRPGSLAEVIACVEQARASKTPLYPISTGRNWGYGSASPVVDGCTVLDLSGMNRILNANEISLANPVAVIEPGVTQRQLHEFLQAHCPELGFNVTGSGADTSLIGNALERGVGYRRPRTEDLFGLEVVTGNGQRLYTGFRRLGASSPLAHSHPDGLGPALEGLFFQSNFGIVTSACFRLLRRAPCEVAVSLALIDPSRLAEFLDALGALKQSGTMASVTHIGNKARSHATLMHGVSRYLQDACGLPEAQARLEATAALKIVAPHDWTGLGSVSGTRGQVRAALAEVRSRMRGLGRLKIVTERRLHLAYKLLHSLRFLPGARAQAAAISAIRPLHGLALGIPTDAAVDNLMWQFGEVGRPVAQLDQSRCGILYISPALPMDGAFVAALLQRLQAKASEFDHQLFITVNVETATSMVAVINLLFDRQKADEVARAHGCAQALYALLRAHHLEVYRARTDMMADIVSAEDPYWQTVRELKRVLDPDDIIAPGRYSLR